MDDKPVFVPCWYYNFDSLAQKKDCRYIDVQKDNPNLVTGTTVVYMEVAFDYSSSPPRPHYSGKHITRRVKQSIRGFDGIKKGYVMLLIEELDAAYDLTHHIGKEVYNRAREFDEKGGVLPFPR